MFGMDRGAVLRLCARLGGINKEFLENILTRNIAR